MFGDRNFDDLAHRFERNVYGDTKGQIRLKVLERDLTEQLPDLFHRPVDSNGHNEETTPLSILDAGGGRGILSQKMAQAGHSVTLCDVSVEMLKLAQGDKERLVLGSHFYLMQGAIQQLPDLLPSSQQFDVILCHAVVEWLEDPLEALTLLSSLLKPNGYLSLTFYNRDGLIFKNLLRTNFGKITKEQYRGARRSLTPTYPRTLDEVTQWLKCCALSPLTHSGIRVFHDYILCPNDREKTPEQQIELELKFSQQSPFREMGRYQHILSRA